MFHNGTIYGLRKERTNFDSGKLLFNSANDNDLVLIILALSKNQTIFVIIRKSDFGPNYLKIRFWTKLSENQILGTTI